MVEIICKTADPDKLTSWENEPSWKDLNEDYEKAKISHEMYLTRLKDYRQTLAGGPPLRVKKGRSTFKPLVVRKNNEWKYSQLEEPYLSTPNIASLRPKGPDDTNKVKQADALINHYWNTAIDRITLIGTIVRQLVDDGTVIVKNGWYTEKEKYYTDEEVPLYATAEESIQLMKQMVANGELSQEEYLARLETGTPLQIGTEVVRKERWKLKKIKGGYGHKKIKMNSKIWK